MLLINEISSEPLYFQIYRQLKEKIISGELETNSKLPSTRTLAKSLSVARNTVESAYSQLCLEGYIWNKASSGFYVEKMIFMESCFEKKQGNMQEDLENTLCDEPQVKIDFLYGKLSLDQFPLGIWKRLTNEVLLSSESVQLACYNHRQGQLELRDEIMKYLSYSRGVKCHPDQIILNSGTQQNIELLCKIFGNIKKEVAFEEPGYDGVRMVFVDNGYIIRPVPVNAQGIDIDMLIATKARIVFITPSHQFPTGAIMPIKNRIRLLKWAEDNHGIIIEDDYDSELRYNGKPIPSLQSIDQGEKVVYMGTFSKGLSPAIRIGYMVLPQNLLKRYKAHFSEYKTSVSWIEQKVLYRYMKDGHWERHLRKIGISNKKRHDVLIKEIRMLLGEQVMIHGENAGLHIMLTLKKKKDVNQLLKLALERGVKVYTAKRYWMEPKEESDNALILGFGGLSEDEIKQGVKILKDVWG